MKHAVKCQQQKSTKIEQIQKLIKTFGIVCNQKKQRIRHQGSWFFRFIYEKVKYLVTVVSFTFAPIQSWVNSETPLRAIINRAEP